MKNILYGVYGASGCGRGVMPLAREELQRLGIPLERLVFVDDNAARTVVNGHSVVRYEDFLAIPADERRAVIAVANGGVRSKLAARCADDGVGAWSIVAGNVVVMDDAAVGAGSILCPFVTLTSNIRVGKYFHANLYSYVEHDCTIGDYVTFAPGVKCNGNVFIEDFAYLGSGAVIKQGRPGMPLRIGRGAIVGMGAVVTKDVPAGATVVGNPARLMSKD